MDRQARQGDEGSAVVHSRELELRRASGTSSLEMSESVVRRKVTRGGISFEGFQDFLRTSINLQQVDLTQC
jgi:hypothetical protein